MPVPDEPPSPVSYLLHNETSGKHPLSGSLKRQPVSANIDMILGKNREQEQQIEKGKNL